MFGHSLTGICIVLLSPILPIELPLQIGSLPHLPAGDAELVEQFQLAPELRAGNFAAQKLPVFCDGALDFLWRFVEKFHAEILHAQRQHPFHVFRAGLRLGIEHGVAAASVGLQRVPTVSW
jgi:hypothetical protein